MDNLVENGDGLRSGFEEYAESSNQQTRREFLYAAIDEFLIEIAFKNEAETIIPENVEKTREAFELFLRRTNLHLSAYAFQDILKENSGVHEFRQDGQTPNWYHFFRQVLPKISAVRAGVISEETLDKYGGLDTLITATLYHDSWEDHGRSPHDIYTGLEGYLHTLNAENVITDHELFDMRHRAIVVSQIVDFCTRQIPIRDEFGRFIPKSSGSLEKEQRFDGDLNEYYDRHYLHPFSPWIKWDDSDEGVVTRTLKDTLERPPEKKFSVISNVDFADERRRIYGRHDTDLTAIAAWSEFELIFRSADDNLGVSLVGLETFNDYARYPRLNPLKAPPMRVGQYTHANTAYEHVPSCWRSHDIQIERFEAIAETNIRFRHMMDNAYYPGYNLLKETPHLESDSHLDTSPA